MGNVVSAGSGQNPARQAALKGGLPDHVAALTINKVCGSGLKAVMLAHQGDRDRRHRRCRRGRHGVDEQLSVPPAAGARRLAHGPRRDRGLDDQRRPLVRVRAVSHGERGRSRGRALSRRPRAPRTRSPRAVIRRPPRHRRIGLVQGRDPSGLHSAAKRRPAGGDPRRGDSPGDHRGNARGAQAGLQERRDRHRRERAGRQRRRIGARRDGGRTGPIARHHSPRAHRRSGHQRPAAEVRADDAGRSGSSARGRRSGGTSPTSTSSS